MGRPWQLVQLRSADDVRAVRPVAARPETTHLGVVGLEPAGAEVAYEVRGIAGATEDPVTGSLNGALAQWLRARGLVPASYLVTQGSQVGRRGRILVEDDGTDIWIGGDAVVRVRGELDVR